MKNALDILNLILNFNQFGKTILFFKYSSNK